MRRQPAARGRIHVHVHLPAIYAYAYTNCHCNSHCNIYTNCHCNCDGNSNIYCNCDCHGDFYSHFHPNYNYDSTTNSDIYAYRYFDGYRNYHPAPDSHAYSYYDDYTQANAHGQAACNAEGTTHPATAPDPAARIRFGRRDRSSRRSPSTAKAGRTRRS